MLHTAIVQLIKNTSTLLSFDLIEALIQAKNNEASHSTGELSLQVILRNIEMAKNLQTPICQDTGFPTFFVKIPLGISQKSLKEAIFTATREATKEGFLRPNAVDSLSGKNSGDNTGDEFPKVFFEESDDDQIHIDLLLKGGGSENVSDQISLPSELKDFGKAGRNLDGVKKSVLQVVKNAQGKGCAPGILSVHIGSDRAGGYLQAKKNLLLPIGVVSNQHNKDLKSLAVDILTEANAMNIGPMGLGGKTTLLDCKISASHRLPASFFVTVAYMCWASRRGHLTMTQSGEISVLSPQAENTPESPWKMPEKVKQLHFPLDEAKVRDLKVGDVVVLSGKIFTGRDTIHTHFTENDIDQKYLIPLKESAIYHCGPVALQNADGTWKFTAAGPTTSIREEPYEAKFIEKTGIRAVIGKGGMGQKTLDALQKYGAVYLHAIGGAAAYYAKSVEKVSSVAFLEFGIPEALWEIEVKDFLCIVSMDSHGKTMHK